MSLPLIRTESVLPLNQSHYFTPSNQILYISNVSTFLLRFQVFWTQPCNTNELNKGSHVVRYASHVTHITETSFPTTETNKHCNFVINLQLLDASATGAKSGLRYIS